MIYNAIMSKGTMITHILKKELCRKKTMNIILFMFITMASAFIASSANNVTTINTALDDYFTMANSPDHMLLLSENEASHVETFVTDEQIPYWKQEMWSITKEGIK